MNKFAVPKRKKFIPITLQSSKFLFFAHHTSLDCQQKKMNIFFQFFIQFMDCCTWPWSFSCYPWTIVEHLFKRNTFDNCFPVKKNIVWINSNDYRQQQLYHLQNRLYQCHLQWYKMPLVDTDHIIIIIIFSYQEMLILINDFNYCLTR